MTGGNSFIEGTFCLFIHCWNIDFDIIINRIIVDLSFWSASEFTNIINSDYRIEYYINGAPTPFTAKDLWRDIDLPTDRNNPLNVEVDLAVPIYKFRFYASSIYTSDRNKGRLSIFDIYSIEGANYEIFK